MINRKQCLASLQAYLSEDKEITTIINYCDLWPTEGWRIWQNEYSPYLKTTDLHKIVLRYKEEDYFFKKRDLYAYSSLPDVANMSKKLLLISCNDRFDFLFLGKDDKLRYRRYQGEQYRNEPPLFLPLDIIRELIKAENKPYRKLIMRFLQNQVDVFITDWPNKKLYTEVKQINPIIENSLAKIILGVK